MTRLVVAAAIIKDGLLLAAERSSPANLAGMWELPGGKVEPHEDPMEALHREIFEELGVEIVIGDLLPGPHNGDWPILRGLSMRVWLCELKGGVPAPLQDHSSLAWVDPSIPDGVAWLGPDVPIVEAISRALQGGG